MSVILKTVPSLEFCDGIWWLVQRFGLKKLKRGCHGYFWDTRQVLTRFAKIKEGGSCLVAEVLAMEKVIELVMQCE